MAISKRAPATIHLGGPITYINHVAAIETITPGMLVEYHNDSGVLKWGVHDSADDPVDLAVALEQDEMNLTVDDAYAAGDLMKVGQLGHGAFFWGIVASGANINPGDRLQSAGNGKLKAAATGDVRFVAEEGTGGAVTEDTRLRTKVL